MEIEFAFYRFLYSNLIYIKHISAKIKLKKIRKMNLNHIALTCTSEANADRFYMGILGLKKIKSFCLLKDLTKQIFGLNEEPVVLIYGNDDFSVELFLVDKDEIIHPVFNHTCLEVKDREQIIKKCIARGIEVIKIPKGDSFFLFIRDHEGNLFEIREKSG